LPVFQKRVVEPRAKVTQVFGGKYFFPQRLYTLDQTLALVEKMFSMGGGMDWELKKEVWFEVYCEMLAVFLQHLIGGALT